MTSVIFKKFNKFIFYPDLSNKFLLSSYYSIVKPNNFSVYLRYVFRDHSVANTIGLKAHLMLSSIYPKTCQSSSRLILIKYAKNHCISTIFFKLTLQELAPILMFLIKKPIKTNITLNGFIKESKYFTFPGFVKYLRFPSWRNSVSLSYKQDVKKHLYFLLFYKTAYID